MYIIDKHYFLNFLRRKIIIKFYALPKWVSKGLIIEFEYKQNV